MTMMMSRKILIARSYSWKQSRATASSQLSDGDAMASGPVQSPESLITITITITTIVVLVAVVVENEKKTANNVKNEKMKK